MSQYLITLLIKWTFFILHNLTWLIKSVSSAASGLRLQQCGWSVGDVACFRPVLLHPPHITQRSHVLGWLLLEGLPPTSTGSQCHQLCFGFCPFTYSDTLISFHFPCLILKVLWIVVQPVSPVLCRTTPGVWRCCCCSLTLVLWSCTVSSLSPPSKHWRQTKTHEPKPL